MSCQGLSDSELATKDIKELAKKVKCKLEDLTNKSFDTFEATLYRSKGVIAGTIYLVKVQCGNQERGYLHLRILQAVPTIGGHILPIDWQLNKTLSDPITYF